jgi:type IV secretion system protein VirB9
MTHILISVAFAAGVSSFYAEPADQESEGQAGAAAQAIASLELARPDVGASWKVRGHRSVRPVRISDDGLRTYLEWGAEQSLPAVFAIGTTGAEEVVDGYMRGGLFVIDRVHRQLVFRIDADRAVATRRDPEQ